MSVRAHESWTALLRSWQFALASAALAGLLASAGCVIGPKGWSPGANSMDSLVCAPGRPEHCHCGSAVGCADECDSISYDAACDEAEVRPPLTITLPRLRLPRWHWYEPEAGVFNFCVPPAALGELPPPPPGRFFPVPARPVFIPQETRAVALPPAT